jgi:ribose transport system ATP-binding protein
VNPTLLRVEGLRKQFGGTRALDDVSIEVREREVVGLVGANGAGKSTLLRVLAGQCRADGGRIVLRGQPISPRSAADAGNAGIGMVFQEQSLLPNVSVAENIMLGHEEPALHAGFYRWRTLHALAARQLAKLGCSIAPAARTDSLSFAERQMVELAKALAVEERTQHEPLILLDEPTSMLDAGQIETVLAHIERLRARASVVFVSHRLDEVMRVCDRLYVMTDGRCVAQRERGSFQAADLQQLMLGRALKTDGGRHAAAPPTSGSAVILSLRELSRAKAYRAVSFDLHAGEVLGLAGEAGSGRESLCRTLFGAEAPDSGEILLDGQPIRLGEPADAARLGIGYVPAERRLEGIVAGMSVRENLTLAHVGRLRRGPFIDLARERALVRGWMERLRIQPVAPEMPAHHLSGGNQQKLVLAKWLMAGPPKLLILDHPLRGLDVGAKTEIMRLIRELARDGIGILLIADTLGELVALSDSVVVMKDGVVSGRFPATGTPVSELQLLERMI